MVYVLGYLCGVGKADPRRHRTDAWPSVCAISVIVAWSTRGPSSRPPRSWPRKSRDRDLVLTLGAGNVWQVGERVLEKLREASLVAAGIERKETPNAAGARDFALRISVDSLAPACCSLVRIYASQRIEQFLIRDPHFLLPGPPDYGLESPNLELAGVQYASRAQIVRVFAPDLRPQSVLLPFGRAQKSAARTCAGCTTRLSRGFGRIVSRSTSLSAQPVAFVKLPADGHGALGADRRRRRDSRPAPESAFRLPVLSGIATGESADTARRRVRRMQRLIEELGRSPTGFPKWTRAIWKT